MQVFIIADILDTVCPFGVAWCPRNGAASTAGRSGWSVHRRVQQRMRVADYFGTRAAVSIFVVFNASFFPYPVSCFILNIYFTFRHRLLSYFQSGYPHSMGSGQDTAQCARLQLLSRQEGRALRLSYYIDFLWWLVFISDHVVQIAELQLWLSQHPHKSRTLWNYAVYVTQYVSRCHCFSDLSLVFDCSDCVRDVVRRCVWSHWRRYPVCGSSDSWSVYAVR